MRAGRSEVHAEAPGRDDPPGGQGPHATRSLRYRSPANAPSCPLERASGENGSGGDWFRREEKAAGSITPLVPGEVGVTDCATGWPERI